MTPGPVPESWAGVLGRDQSGRIFVCVFGGPEALRDLAVALQRYAAAAESGNRLWGSICDGAVSFVGCLDAEDARAQAASLRTRMLREVV